MNILVISSIYPEPKDYGISEDTKVVHYFTQYWANQGHKVIVIHPYFNAVKKIKHFTSKYAHRIVHSEIDNVTVVYGESQLFVPHSLFPAKWRQINLAKRMRNYLETNFPDFIPDAVSVHFPVVLLNFVSAFLKKEKALAVLHGTDIRMLLSQNTNRERLLHDLSDIYKLFLFRSPKLKSTGIKLGFDNEKSHTLISGLNQSLIADQDFINRRISATSSVLKLIYAGKLVKQKRIDQVLKALYLLKNNTLFHFDIIGDGTERKELERLVGELGLDDRVYFHGVMSRDDVSKMMSQSDIFIMTSSNETLGLVYLEAMAQGCITIGSKDEGIDGVIINNENGFLVSPDNVDEISACIKSVLQITQNKKSEILNNAYKTVVNLTDVAVSQRYYSMLEKISN